MRTGFLLGRRAYAIEQSSPNNHTMANKHDSGTRGQSSTTSSNAMQGRTTYRVSKHAERSWAALIDRGANGGIAGRDTREVDPEATCKTIDLSGIDDHTVRNLRVSAFGATVRTTKGEVILIMNQYAGMPDGKTIHSCGQMEYHKTQVNDKSAKAVGDHYNACLVLNEGHLIPISFVNGLPYIRMRPYTDEEFRTLPHLHLTSDRDWDPSILDYTVPDDWYDNQKVQLSSIDESEFDVHGEPKEEFLSQEDDHPMGEEYDGRV